MYRYLRQRVVVMEPYVFVDVPRLRISEWYDRYKIYNLPPLNATAPRTLDDTEKVSFWTWILCMENTLLSPPLAMQRDPETLVDIPTLPASPRIYTNEFFREMNLSIHLDESLPIELVSAEALKQAEEQLNNSRHRFTHEVEAGIYAEVEARIAQEMEEWIVYNKAKEVIEDRKRFNEDILKRNRARQAIIDAHEGALDRMLTVVRVWVREKQEEERAIVDKASQLLL
jgi:hypothetical protein